MLQDNWVVTTHAKGSEGQGEGLGLGFKVRVGVSGQGQGFQFDAVGFCYFSFLLSSFLQNCHNEHIAMHRH